MSVARKLPRCPCAHVLISVAALMFLPLLLTLMVLPLWLPLMVLPGRRYAASLLAAEAAAKGPVGTTAAPAPALAGCSPLNALELRSPLGATGGSGDGAQEGVDRSVGHKVEGTEDCEAMAHRVLIFLASWVPGSPWSSPLNTAFHILPQVPPYRCVPPGLLGPLQPPLEEGQGQGEVEEG